MELCKPIHYEMPEQVVPMDWKTQGGRTIYRRTPLRDVARLSDGIYELCRMRKWCEARGHWFTKILNDALTTPGVESAVAGAMDRIRREGRERREAVLKRGRESEMRERNEKFGFMSA